MAMAEAANSAYCLATKTLSNRPQEMRARAMERKRKRTKGALWR